MHFQKIVRLSVTLLFGTAFVLTACSKQPNIPSPPKQPYHALTAKQKALLASVKQTGVQVIKTGEVVRIVIPTDRYFRPQTTQIKPSYRWAMKKISLFVKSYSSGYRQPVIRVYGFTDTVFSTKTRKGLSREYAHVVASYLWNYGIPSRRMYIRGFGAKYPIASNRYPGGSVFNRRVVIQIN